MPFDVDEQQHGLYADQVEGVGGLDFLLDYAGGDEPFQVRYQRLPLALLAGWQHDHGRLAALERRLEAAGL